MGRRRLDLINQRFGKLIVIKEAGIRKGHALCLCQCDCGKQKIVQGRLLVQAKTKSCGCLNHGDTTPKRTKEYISWQKMKSRCLDPNNSHYENYGGKGITVYQRWKNDYTAFLSDMGRCPQGMTLGRLDNSKDFSPGNCRWEPRKKQALNRKRTVFLEYKGISLCQEDWARLLGVSRTTIQRHRAKGELIEDMIKHFNKPMLLNAPYTHPEQKKDSSENA